jgi:MOSC domain-containing protein YiiM
MGSLVSIVYKPEHLPPRPPERFTREPLTEATLVVGHGIEGDCKGKGERQVNLMAAENLEQLGSEGFKTAPGEMGEQLVVRGIDVAALQAGDRLRLGAEAVLEVVRPRTGCQRFMEIQNKPLTATRGRMGMILMVVADGVIRVGDPVRVEERTATPR